MGIETTPFKASDYMDTKEEALAFLNFVLEDMDSRLFQKALGEVAKSKSMTEIARDAGVSRESLYKSLSAEGNPSWQTILKVLRSLGFKLQVVPVDTPVYGVDDKDAAQAE